MEKVYAQGYHLLQNQFPFYLSSGEIEVLNQNNEEFRQQTMEEELLQKWFIPAKNNFEEYLTQEYTTTELMMEILEKENIKNQLPDNKQIQRLGKALAKHQYIRISKRRGGTPQYVWKIQNKK